MLRGAEFRELALVLLPEIALGWRFLEELEALKRPLLSLPRSRMGNLFSVTVV